MDEKKDVLVVVCCISCKNKVEVKLVPYGGGHAAVCPLCGKLAYNGK